MIHRNILADSLGPYKLLSIATRVPPQGSEGTWFQYVIVQGASQVTGVRSGTAAEVEQFLREMVERLNERRIGKTRPRIKPQPSG